MTQKKQKTQNWYVRCLCSLPQDIHADTQQQQYIAKFSERTHNTNRTKKLYMSLFSPVLRSSSKTKEFLNFTICCWFTKLHGKKVFKAFYICEVYRKMLCFFFISFLSLFLSPSLVVVDSRHRVLCSLYFIWCTTRLLVTPTCAPPNCFSVCDFFFLSSSLFALGFTHNAQAFTFFFFKSVRKCYNDLFLYIYIVRE